MSLDKFNSIADIPAIQADIDTIVALLKKLGLTIEVSNAQLKENQAAMGNPEGAMKLSLAVQDATKNLTSLSGAVVATNKLHDEMNALQAKAAYLTTEDAKAKAALTVQTREQSKALIANAEANNTLFQANKARIAAAKELKAATEAQIAADKLQFAEGEKRAAQINEEIADYERLQKAKYGQNSTANLTPQQQVANVQSDANAQADASIAAIRNSDTVAITENTAAKAKGTITAAEYQAVLRGELTILEDGTLAAKQNAVAVLQDLTASQQAAGVLSNYKIELAGVTGEMKANTLALKEGIITEEQFANQQAVLTERQIVLQGQISGQTKVVKDLSGVTKEAEESSSKLESTFTRMALRLGLTLTVFAGAQALLKSLKESFNTWWDSVNIGQTAAKEAAEHASNAFTKEAVELETLKRRWNDSGVTMTEQKEIVEELNKKLGAQGVVLNTLDEANDFFIKKSADVIAALKLRGQVTASITAIETEYAKQIKINADPAEYATFINKFAAVASSFQKMMQAPSGGTNKAFSIAAQEYTRFLSQNINKGAQEAINTSNKIINELNLRIDDASAKAAALDAKTHVHTDLNPGAGKKGAQYDPTAAELKGQEDLIKATANNEKFKQDLIAESNKAIYDDETKSLEDRVTAYAKYEDARKAIADIGYHEEIDTLNAKLALINKIESGNNDKNGAYEKNLLKEKAAILQEIETAESKHQDVLGKIDKDASEARTKTTESESKKQADTILSSINNIAENYSEQYKKDNDALLASYSAGTISTQAYEDGKVKIKEKYNDLAIKDTIDYLEESLQLEGFTEKEIETITEKLTDFKKKQNDEQVKDEERKARAVADIKELEYQTERKLIEDTAKIADELVDAGSKKRLAAIDAETAAVEKQKDADIKALQLTGLSEEQKADKQAEIEGIAAAREAQLAQKKDQEEKATAQRKKQITVAQIAIEGALAVIHELTTGDPYTAFARAAAAGIIVAAELAVAIATPAYKYGTPKEGHPGGKMLVGEENKREFIIDPLGNISSVSSPTLMYGAPGTHVIPEDKMNERLISMLVNPSLLFSQSSKKENNTQELIDAFEKSSNKTVKAIMQKKMVVINNINLKQSAFEKRENR